jgi:hypothetical protein
LDVKSDKRFIITLVIQFEKLSVVLMCY